MRFVKSKYRATPVEFDGIKFASKKEGTYYLRLKEMQERGEIENLRLQVPYELVPKVTTQELVHLKTKDKIITKILQRPITYVADFVYTKDGKEVVVDTKGFRTEAYKLKKKMMLAFHGIQITEV